MKIDFDLPIYQKKKLIAKIAGKEHNNWYKSTLEYFKNYEYAFAIKTLKITILKNPKSFENMNKRKIFPPQNYTFIDDDIEKWIENE